MINIENKEKCCGCTACATICAHQAIHMEQDIYGFVFPYTEPAKCVSCGLCEHVCPMSGNAPCHESMSRRVALAADLKEQHTSSSGGLASVLARTVIEKLKGVVYGCTAEDPHHIWHTRVTRIEELGLIKGSKYVQSDMEGIMEQVKRDIREKRDVLFIGTPCQCAALQLFLPRHGGKLFLIDFICHGVPSQKMLSQLIHGLKLKKDVCTLAFRRKKLNGKSEYGLFLQDQARQTLYQGTYGYDRYITAFLKGLNYRDSCYACPFASTARPGDLTLGDYWDSKHEYTHLPHHNHGLSQLHVNTLQGKRLLQLANGAIISEEIPLQKLLVHSHQLSSPTPRHPQTAAFFEAFSQQPFPQACNVVLHRFFRTYPRHALMCRLRKMFAADRLKQFIHNLIHKT